MSPNTLESSSLFTAAASDNVKTKINSRVQGCPVFFEVRQFQSLFMVKTEPATGFEPGPVGLKVITVQLILKLDPQ